MGRVIDIAELLKGVTLEDTLKKSKELKDILKMDSSQYRGVIYLLNLMWGMQLELLKDYVCDLTGIIADLKGKSFSSEERQKLAEYLEFDLEKTIEMIKRQSSKEGLDHGDLN